MTAKRTRTSVPPTLPGRARHRTRDDVHATTPQASPTAGAVFDPPPVVPQSVARHLRVAFGINLKAARLERGLHPSDLAHQMGLTALRLSLIKSGELTITLRTMTRLARLVGLRAGAMLNPARRDPERK